MAQHKELQEHSHFLDTKKVIILSILFAVTIGLIVFSILMLKVNFSDLGGQIASAYNTHGNLVILLFFMLAIYLFFKYIMVIVPFLIRLKQMGIKVNFKDQLLFVLSFCFIQAITPGPFITEPYLLFWLKTKGVSTAKATAIVWINEFMWHIASFVMILPSFIIVCMTFSSLDIEMGAVFALACVGFGIDCVMLVVFILMGSSKHFHYFLSRSFNIVKKWFKLNYHTKQQTEQKYLIEGYLQQQAKEYLINWKTCLLIILLNAMCQAAMFTELFVALQLLSAQPVNYWSVFNVVNVVTTGNKYLPIPGGEGMIQWQLKKLLLSLKTNLNEETIGNGIFLWRCSTTYFGAVIGLSAFIMMIVIYAKAIINKKKIIIKPKE